MAAINPGPSKSIASLVSFIPPPSSYHHLLGRVEMPKKAQGWQSQWFSCPLPLSCRWWLGKSWSTRLARQEFLGSVLSLLMTRTMPAWLMLSAQNYFWMNGSNIYFAPIVWSTLSTLRHSRELMNLGIVPCPHRGYRLFFFLIYYKPID